jgi:hypothetical protein
MLDRLADDEPTVNVGMRYAAAYKDDAEPLARFVKRKGGINKCTARYGRCPQATCRPQGLSFGGPANGDGS